MLVSLLPHNLALWTKETNIISTTLFFKVVPQYGQSNDWKRLKIKDKNYLLTNISNEGILLRFSPRLFLIGQTFAK